MLRVKADAPDFWRGAAFDRYDGRVWSQSPAVTASGPTEDLEGGGVDNGGLAVPRFDVMRQAVRVEASAIGVVFGAPLIQGVNLPRGSYDVRSDGSFQLRTPLGKGAQYVVTSDRALTTTSLLRTNDPRTSGMSPDLERLYVQSGGATPRVAALAAQIAGDAPTTYDAIRALEAWLGENTKYTLDIPPLPAGADTVEQFLFVDKRGFCMQIASSLTVMLRSIGVPARLVTGFAPGEESLLGGEFTVRGEGRPRLGRGLVPGCRMAGLRSHGERAPRGGVLELDRRAPVAGRAAVDPGAPRDRPRRRRRGWRRAARASPSATPSREAMGIALLRVGAEGRREARETTRAFGDSRRIRACSW